MEQFSNTLQMKGKSASKVNVYKNNENIPQNEQSFKLYDSNIEDNFKDDVSENFKVIEENEIKVEEKITESDSDSYVRQDSDINVKHIDIGEPSVPQHITIDFTPTRGIDDQALQQKCMDFWKFVDGQTMLQGSAIKGEDYYCTMIPDINTNTEGNFHENENIKQAIKGLKGINNVAKVAFETMQPHSYLDFGDHYATSEQQKQKQRQMELKKISNGYGQSKPEFQSKSLKNGPSRTRLGGVDEVDRMCHEMEQWDKLHPKSMDPPKTLNFRPT